MHTNATNPNSKSISVDKANDKKNVQVAEAHTETNIFRTSVHKIDANNVFYELVDLLCGYGLELTVIIIVEDPLEMVICSIFHH